MSKSIRVRIMGRNYPLRVDPADEEYMREIAEFVDEKMQAVRENFPGQPELTSAVIASLSIAEELIEEREKREGQHEEVHGEVTRLIQEIDQVVGEESFASDQDADEDAENESGEPESLK